MQSKIFFLSYPISLDTQGYANRDKLQILQQSSISNGDSCNNSTIDMSLHLGTHIDFPRHFYNDGLCANNFEAPFFVFKKPLIIEIEPKSNVVYNELAVKLESIQNRLDYDLLLIKTGEYKKRGENDYVFNNIGFDGKIAIYLRENFPNIRAIGFDTISVSSYKDRQRGKAAHLAFLAYNNPILLIEDMDLSQINQKLNIRQIIVAPLIVENADAAPCTVFCEVND